jgi:translation elongation factor EF-Tu-like GTPase
LGPELQDHLRRPFVEVDVRLFSKVQDVFRVTGRGWFVLLGAMEPGIRVKPKDSIQPRTPDRRVLDTEVAAIEFVSGKLKSHVAFGFPSNVKEEDAPRGTEVWVVRDDSAEKSP